MEYGIWNLEYGIWNMEYGIWNEMEYGMKWNMECIIISIIIIQTEQIYDYELKACSRNYRDSSPIVCHFQSTYNELYNFRNHAEMGDINHHNGEQSTQ